MWVFLERDSIYATGAIRMLSPVRPSVSRVNQSKTVEILIMQLSPHDSSFLTINFTAEFQREHRVRGRPIRAQ